MLPLSKPRCVTARQTLASPAYMPPAWPWLVPDPAATHGHCGRMLPWHPCDTQVCLLGSGSIIGDMAMRDAKGGPSRRSATVIALTATHTYACSLREFRRRMPADVLEVCYARAKMCTHPLSTLLLLLLRSVQSNVCNCHALMAPHDRHVSSQSMRAVASKKLVMNEHKANSRAAAEAAGQDGHVLLGGAAVPEGVLRGRGLRALLDAQQAIGSGGDAACVGGMLAGAAVPHLRSFFCWIRVPAFA